MAIGDWQLAIGQSASTHEQWGSASSRLAEILPIANCELPIA
jgi:hypothetical protein